MSPFLKRIELDQYLRGFGFIRDAVEAFDNKVNSISVQRIDQELLDTTPHNVGPDPEAGFDGDGVSIFFINDQHSNLGMVEQRKTVDTEFKLSSPSTWVASWIGREQNGETVAEALRQIPKDSLSTLKYVLWLEQSPRAGKRIIIFKVPRIINLDDFIVFEMERAAQKVANHIKEQVDQAS